MQPLVAAAPRARSRRAARGPRRTARGKQVPVG